MNTFLRLFCVMALSGCSAEYTCTFDDPAVGDVFRVTTISCSDYRSVGIQIEGSDRLDCQEEAETLGGVPVTCTCEWSESCSGSPQD